MTRQYKDAANLAARSSLHQRYSTNQTGWFKWVFDHLLNLPVDYRILELGCGPGWVWLYNRERIPASWHVVLSDLSPGMVDQARANLEAGCAARFQLHVMDAQAIAYDNASYDAVIANHMLYHVPNRPQALSEIRRVLKPGGQLFAATNGRNHMAEIWDLVLEVTGAARGVNRSELHFGLDNGIEQLAPWFSQIQRQDYRNALLVTEAEPLVAYVASSALWGTQDNANATELVAERVRLRLARDGVIRITTSTGMFVAYV